MQAIRFYGEKDLRLEKIDKPVISNPHDVIVEVQFAGVCGSDIHNYQTGMWISKTPVTPGHEFSGIVKAVGDSVSSVSVDDRVVVDSRVPCGHCSSCKQGRPNICLNMGYLGEVCDGGFAEQVVLPETALIRYDKSIKPEVAALSEPLAVALHAIKRLNINNINAPVLVAGAGPIGGLSCILLSHLGYKDLSFIEINEHRKKLISDLSGAVSIDLQELPEKFKNNGCAVIEATGNSTILKELISQVGPGSQIALVGIFSQDTEIDFNRVVEGEIEIFGSSVFTNEQTDVIKLIPLLEDKLIKLLSAPISLSMLPDAMDQLSSGITDSIKTVIEINS